MARTNLHVLASRLLACLAAQSVSGRFEGKLRQAAVEAGLNSVRSAEAVKLLESLGRIEVLQRGRRGRDTIIVINSVDEVVLEDAQTMLPARTPRKAAKLDYENLGRTVVDRLIELGRDDSLRAAQVEAFANESAQQARLIERLQAQLEDAEQRETDLRIRLKAAEGALSRAEENLSRAFGFNRPAGEPVRVEDDDAQAVLDILKAGQV